MFRKIISLAVLAVLLAQAAPVAAQMRDSVFRDYDAYAAFVDRTVKARKFAELILVLGGRDEYTREQLQAAQDNFLRIYDRNFTERVIFLERDLGGGIRQEVRGYHVGESYIWFYAIMHQRADDLVVINFKLNSSINAVLEPF